VCKELVDAEIASGDYPAVERDLLRAERDNPADKNFIKSLRARAALERGDLAAARATAEQVSPGFVANLPFGLLRVRLAMCERDFSRAETALQEIPRDEGGEDLVAALAVCQREIDRCSKRATTAQELLETGRGIILKQLGAKPNDPELLSALALVDAEAGRQDEALESGKKAVELRPVRQDAVIGPFVARRLAQVYALKGDRDSAIEQLGSIASIQGGLTKGDLLNPLWDELRSDPRFDQISRVVAGKVK
jgi:tetratricopeptide (TPR) repeat protein